MSATDETFTKDVRVRFAPSPTGWMHIGSIWLVMFNYLWARKNKGTFILRVEDTDAKRTVKGGVDAIFETFEAFGIEVDEGPNVGGEYGPYVQSQRLDLYKKYAEELIDKGAAYYCFCSEDRLKKLREQQVKSKKQPMYDGLCRNVSVEEARKRIAAGEKAVVRLKVPKTGVTEYEDIIHGTVRFKNSVIDDQVLLKSDGFPTYHFAVVIDDHLMKISHVLRGVEYVSSAPKIILLYNAFGWKIPFIIQTPSILDPDGRKKLSKRGGGNAAIKFLRKGYLDEALWNFLMLLGWAPSDKDGNKDEIYSRDDLQRLFDLRRVRRSGARFFPEKLEHFNGYYIRQMPTEEFADRIVDWAEKYVLREFISDKVIGLLDWEEKLISDITQLLPLWEKDREKFLKILPLIQERVKYLAEIPDFVRFFYTESLEYSSSEFEGVGSSSQSEALETVWKELKPVVSQEWEQETWESTIRECADTLGWKHGELFMLLRLAMVGRKVSPPLFESMEIMGAELCDVRVQDTLKFLKNT